MSNSPQLTVLSFHTILYKYFPNAQRLQSGHMSIATIGFMYLYYANDNYNY